MVEGPEGDHVTKEYLDHTIRAEISELENRATQKLSTLGISITGLVVGRGVFHYELFEAVKMGLQKTDIFVGCRAREEVADILQSSFRRWGVRARLGSNQRPSV